MTHSFPTRRSSDLGSRDGEYGKWDDVSDEAEVARHKLQQETAAALRASYVPANLSPDDALSFELFNAQAARQESLFAFRHHTYMFNHMRGAQQRMPPVLQHIYSLSNPAKAPTFAALISHHRPAPH